MPQKSRPQPGKGLSRKSIVTAAIGLIERDGARALSMRSLGRELGVEAMSLYRYVPNFEALLDAVVNQVVDAMLGDPEMRVHADEDWRAFLTRQAHGVRRIAVAQPEVFPLIATRTPGAPWIRPPLRSLRWIEEFLAGLLARGFADAGAAAAYRSFTSFLLGNLLLEVSAAASTRAQWRKPTSTRRMRTPRMSSRPTRRCRGSPSSWPRTTPMRSSRPR